MSIQSIRLALHKVGTNHTVQAIIDCLENDDVHGARAIYFNDGDKVSSDLRYYVEDTIGCRLHGLIGCSEEFCYKK